MITVGGEHRLQVEDRGAVEGFQVPDVDPGAADLEHLDVVQADRVGTVG